MNFAALGSLLWLIPGIGFIVALYMMRMRRKDTPIAGTFLWPPMTYELRSNSMFQRLRFSWLMVLQILALALVILALAKPQILQRASQAKVTAVILDTSASMGSVDVAPSRLEQAKQRVEKMIGSVRTGERLAVIDAGATPRVVFPLSQDTVLMRDRLKQVEASDAPGNMSEALKLAASLVGNMEGGEIVVLSDGVFSPVSNFSPGKAAVRYIKIGEKDKNLAVDALGPNREGTEVFLGISNTGSVDASTKVTLTLDGKVINSYEISLAPKARDSRSIPITKRGSILVARLEAEDSLAADNFGAASLNQQSTIRTLLVSDGDFFLERALVLDPRIQLERSATVTEDAKRGVYDLVIFEGKPIQPVVARAVMSFGSESRDGAITTSGQVLKPKVDETSDSPVFEGVDLSAAFIDSAKRYSVGRNSQVLASAKGIPLVVMQTRPRPEIHVAFRPGESDFPLLVGFPIFIANALEALVDEVAKEGVVVADVGRTIFLPAAPLGVAADLTGPGIEGKIEVKSVDQQYLLRDIRKVGRYKLAWPGGERTILAKLSSATESNLAPKDSLSVGGSTVRESNSVLTMGDLWRWAVVFGLLVLATEWWLFARKS